MKYILGKKIEMTQKFKENGEVIPVTVISAGPCYITQVRSADKDGYKAIQVGYGQVKKLNKPLGGHLKDIVKARYLKELRLEAKDEKEYQKGQEISVAIFNKGDNVKITGISKGKGFQGGVKRYGFKGHKETHGTKDQVRHGGSIGAGGPQHVFKGTRMAGRMGGTQVSIANLEIVDIDVSKNLLFIKGAVPGSRNTLVEVFAPGEMDLLKKVKSEEPQEIVKEPIEPEKEISAEAEKKE